MDPPAFRPLRAAVATGTALTALLGVEAGIAASGEYLIEADYLIDSTVHPAGRPGNPAEDAVELRVFGDSTAAGVGSPTVGESLPVLVAQRVANGLRRPVHVVCLGVSGARTDSVRVEQLARMADPQVDVTLVVVGSNDVTHLTPVWRMGKQTERLLWEARRRTRSPVVLGGIPRFYGVGALPEPLRTVTDRYAGVLRKVQRRTAAAIDGVSFVDIAALASPRFVGVPEAMSSDAFHPAPVGYGYWADALAPAVATAVAERS